MEYTIERVEMNHQEFPRNETTRSRYDSTIGWFHFMESLTRRSAVSVALGAPVALAVPDMWSRANPTCDYFWHQACCNSAKSATCQLLFRRN
jgi:hypothetical protein